MKLQITARLLGSVLMLWAAGAGAVEAPAEAVKAARPPAATAPAAPTFTAPALSVDEILNRNATARGGLDAWRKVDTLAFSGKLDAGRAKPAPGPDFANPNAGPKERRKSRITRERDLEAAPVIQLPFNLEVARGRKSRLEVTVKDATAIQVYDGKTGWKVRPFMGPERRKPEAFTSEELKLAADQADLDGWLLDARSKGNKVEAEGVDGVDGKAAYKLKVTLPTGDVRHVWVDAESFLDVKVEGQRRFDGKLRPMYTALKDYREVDGIRIPYLMETRIEGGRDTERLIIEKATVNPALPADRFSKL